jgi:xylulose-5-phosphate/fructose-6-phosphate phosphoketolase
MEIPLGPESVSDKQLHLQYMDMAAAIQPCTKGIGIWKWASNDQGGEPDLVMASAGDIPTQEALAAIALLRQEFSDIKIRYINVVDLFKLQPSTEHLHGLTDKGFDSLFTADKPIVFNFHGYPWLIHRWPTAARTMAICLQRKGQHQHPAGVGHQQRDRSS